MPLIIYQVNLLAVIREHVIDKETHAICSSRRTHRCLLLFWRKVNDIVYIICVYILNLSQKVIIECVWDCRRGLVTCGCDGDVRSWLNLMDDDPTTSCISEQAITAISKVFNSC